MSNNEESLLTPDASLLDIDDADDLFIKPKKKYKIVMLSDHQLAPSGVGVQARFLIEGLIATGKYSFRCLGGAIQHEKYDMQVVNEDFVIRPVDGFGTREMIRELLIVEQPDAVLLFTDPRQFIWLWEIEDEIHQVCPITYWHVWDNDPYPEFNEPWYESTDLINCLSKKTYDLVKPHFPDKTNYIPHAFPKGVYQPVPKEQLEQLAQQNFSDKADWFKVLWVNRNATRKMPADVLVSWGKFLKNLEEKYGHKRALLIMHTDPGDREGPNLLAVTNHLQINDNVWFSTDKVNFQNMNLLHNLTDTTVNVAKNEGFGLCLNGNTLISTPKGYKFLKDISIGEMVKSDDNNFHKVLATSSRKENKLVKIKFHGNNPIVSSREHRFLVKDGSGKIWKQAQELKQGDCFCYPKSNAKSSFVNQIDLLDWVDNEKVISNKDTLEKEMGFSPYKNGLSIVDIQKEFGVTKHYAECIRSVGLGLQTTRKHNLKKIKLLIKEYENKTGKSIKFNNAKQKINRFINADKDFFHFLGWYLAEGSNNNGKGLELNLHKNEIGVAQWAQNFIFKKFNPGYSGVTEQYDNKSRFYCSSQILSEFFGNICGVHSYRKKIHENILGSLLSNEEHIGFLLRGLFLGDGYFSKNKRSATLQTTSSLLAIQVRDLLFSKDIMCSLHRRKTQNKDAFTVRVFGKDYEKFCNLVNIEANKGQTDIKSIEKFDKDFAYFPITSVEFIEKEKPETLFDIQVEDSQNFIANGIVSHNSTLASLMCGKPIIALCTGGETSKAIDPKDGSANGVALHPVKRSMVGSQLVPYIYEDLACNEQTAEAFMTIFEMTDEDKEKMKEKVLEFTDREFNYEKMIKNWDETLEASIKAYKAQKETGRGSWDLTIMNPIVNVSIEDDKIQEKTEEKTEEKKPKKKKKKESSGCKKRRLSQKKKERQQVNDG